MIVYIGDIKISSATDIAEGALLAYGYLTHPHRVPFTSDREEVREQVVIRAGRLLQRDGDQIGTVTICTGYACECHDPRELVVTRVVFP